MEEDIKTSNVSIGFTMDLEKILNYISENNAYEARIGNINISFIGEKDKRQVFEIERRVE